ncbi:hypothetical protein G6F56_013259 [Rhizopus delemar]|nr:hypothetical protein G6F56_013259 [Rhizopus delemar]
MFVLVSSWENNNYLLNSGIPLPQSPIQRKPSVDDDFVEASETLPNEEDPDNAKVEIDDTTLMKRQEEDQKRREQEAQEEAAKKKEQDEKRAAALRKQEEERKAEAERQRSRKKKTIG